MSTKNGHIILIVMVLMGVLSVGVLEVSRMMMLAKQTQRLGYTYVKCQYLAQSGLAVAPQSWNQVPVLSISVSNPKPFLYARLANCYHPILPLEGDCYLARDSQDRIYSIGVWGSGKRLVRATAAITSANVQLSGWEFL